MHTFINGQSLNLYTIIKCPTNKCVASIKCTVNRCVHIYKCTVNRCAHIYKCTVSRCVHIYKCTVTKIEFIPLQLGKNQMYPASAMALLECIDQTLNSGIQLLDLGVSLYILMNWQYLIWFNGKFVYIDELTVFNMI